MAQLPIGQNDTQIYSCKKTARRQESMSAHIKAVTCRCNEILIRIGHALGIHPPSLPSFFMLQTERVKKKK